MRKLTTQYPRRRAFVTGAGAGIGRALCHALARDGWAVGVADFNPAAAEQVAREVDEQGGLGTRYVFDVSDADAFRDAAESFLGENDGCDLLVNNAGIADLYEFHECSNEVWQKIDATNRLGVIYGCQAFVPTFIRQRSGTIVNVGSVASFASPPGLSAYSASKASVLAITECLYAELRPHRVHAALAIPFIVSTDLFSYADRSAKSRASATQLQRWFAKSPAQTASAILDQAARRRLHILTSASARALFSCKRHFPQGFMDLQALLSHRFANLAGA